MYYLTKKINRIFIGVLFLVLSACNDDFLETQPLSQVSPKNFFKTKEDLKLYVNQYYTSLPNHRGWGGGFSLDSNSDNAPANNARVRGESRVPASGGYSWGNIRSVNYFLEKVKENDHDKSTDLDIKQYIGEAYFFRAWYYFGLLKSFGNLPWIDKTLKADIKELALSRISRKTIVENMVGDLDKAIANMKDGNAGAYSRVNKQVAQALKARICLYEGTWEKYHATTPFEVAGSDGKQFIQWAASTAKEIMDSGKYQLYKGSDPSKIEGDEYFSLFNKLDYSGNKEIIFWAKNSEKLRLVHNVNRNIVLARAVLSKNFVDDYLMADGTEAPNAKKNAVGYYDAFDSSNSWTEKKQQLTYMTPYTKIYNEVKGRDPRFAQSIFHIGMLKFTKNPGGVPKAKSPKDELFTNFNLPTGATGYALKKGLISERSQHRPNLGTLAGIVFRYAEILLIYAEAKAELGDDAAAKMAIDQLRERVGMAKLSTTMPSGSDVLKEVRRERRIELVGEGFRFDDLLRWRKAHEVFGTGKRPLGIKWNGNTDLQARYKKDFKFITNLDGDESAPAPEDRTPEILRRVENGFISPLKIALPKGYNFNKDVDYLLPINNRDISLSEGKLKQNPGWEKRN